MLSHSASPHPKLSIVVTTYNREHMLAKCLDSIVPTTANCEILIFDDASTDGTPALVHSYADSDARIRYIQQPVNLGVTANVELGVKQARGDFIALIADDDSVEPGNYERKAAILEAYPEIGFVYSLAYGADENLLNPRVLRRPEYLDHSYIGDRAEFADLISGNYIYGNSVVFRRSLIGDNAVIDRTLPTSAYPLSDWDLWLRMTLHTQTAFINEPLVTVRFHSATLSGMAGDMDMGMIAVWRRWLVDRQDPPTLDRRTWDRMQAVFLSEVQRLHSGDLPTAEASVAAFEDLRRAASVNASLSFAHRTRTIMTRTEAPTGTAVIWTGPVWGIGGMASDVRGIGAAAEVAPSVVLRLEDLNWGEPAVEPEPGEQRKRIDASLWRPLPAGGEHIHVWHGPLEHFHPDISEPITVARVVAGDEPPSTVLLDIAVGLDWLWLPSQFDCDVLAEAGVPREKLRILPGCVNVDDNSGVMSVDLETGRRFNFTSMVRLTDPGLEVLVRAFVREFKAKEDVALVLILRTPPGQSVEQLTAELQALIQREVGGVTRELAPINLRVGQLSEDGIRALLAASQAYVEPRPSTWGMGVLEAMARCLPIVGTQIGPNAGRLNSGNSFSIASALTPALLGRLMRQAFSSPKEARRRGVSARADVEAKHSPQAVGQRLRQLVDELQAAEQVQPAA
jgi:glycosyltransferase involved in cell wall biosynthesis